MSSEWDFAENELQFTIVSNRFLHHMVRFLVGTMINVSQNKVDFIMNTKDFGMSTI